jgi:hypothetical protein
LSSAEGVCFRPLHEIAQLIAARAVSPIEVIDAYLRRCERLNPVLNAFVTLAGEAALAAARAAASGPHVGPLHGVPIGLKDVFDTAGIRTTYGSSFFREHVPAADAVAVARFARRRRYHSRQMQHARVRRRLDHEQSLVRRLAKPLGPGAFAGRLEWRLRSCGRSLPVRRSHGHRHRRLGACSGCLQRDRRPQADLRAGQPSAASSRTPGASTWPGRSRARCATPA